MTSSNIISKPVIRLKKDNFTHNLWGGHWIPRRKGLAIDPTKPVGESWEFSCHSKKLSWIDEPELGEMSLLDYIKQNSEQLLGKVGSDQMKSGGLFLLKLIDAQDDLSVQVHPDNDYAKAHEKDGGKDECWVILESGQGDDEGYIYLGFSEKLNKGHLEKSFWNAIDQVNTKGPSPNLAVRKESEKIILPFINKIKTKPGDVYSVPPGTIHSIGKGVRVLEIQQPSDLTYRVWDWNRPATGSKQLKSRELHISQAKEVTNLVPQAPKHFNLQPNEASIEKNGEVSAKKLIENKMSGFQLTRIQFTEKNANVAWPIKKSFCSLTVTKGQLKVSCMVGGKKDFSDQGEIEEGRTVFIPATTEKVKLNSITAESEVFIGGVVT